MEVFFFIFFYVWNCIIQLFFVLHNLKCLCNFWISDPKFIFEFIKVLRISLFIIQIYILNYIIQNVFIYIYNIKD